jgi:hypothetical protein
MNALEMPRKKTGYSLDTRVIDAVQVLADRAGKSANQFLEKMLFDYAQLNGVIDEKEQPLGEGRGGKRPGAGKPKRSPTDEPPIDPNPMPDTGEGADDATTK